MGPQESRGQSQEARDRLRGRGGGLGDDEGDIYHVDVRDDDHSEGEDRYVTFGSHPADRRLVLRISWTTRIGHKGRVTRIISARPATKAERKHYAEEIRDY
jgi:uncharacterized DUF497 family protein